MLGGGKSGLVGWCGCLGVLRWFVFVEVVCGGKLWRIWDLFLGGCVSVGWNCLLCRVVILLCFGRGGILCL